MAGVVAALSVVSDLTRGHPPGEAMRACLLAAELARRAGLDERRRGEVYYGTLMRFAGCAATSHEIAAVFGGDDIVVRARGDLIDPAEPGEAVEFLAGLGVDAVRLEALGGPAGVARLKAGGGAGRLRGRRGPDGSAGAAGGGAARGPGQLRAVRWPRCPGRAGAEVAEASRFAAVGFAAVMFDAVGGGEAAAGAVARWSVHQLFRRVFTAEGIRILASPQVTTSNRISEPHRANAVGAVSPRGHGRFRIGAPGAGDDLPFCGQHKTNTTPGSGKDQHGNNTDKTVLPGIRRHAC